LSPEIEEAAGSDKFLFIDKKTDFDPLFVNRAGGLIGGNHKTLNRQGRESNE
jgi:hypothetical protein